MKTNVLVSSFIIGSLMVTPMAFGGQSGQSSQQAGQHHGDNKCILGQIKHTVKKAVCKTKKAVKKTVCKTKKVVKHAVCKTKKAVVKTGDSIQNKVMDTGVAAKKKITGKKCKTFVKGHYQGHGKKQVHVAGHWRKLACSGKSS